MSFSDPTPQEEVYIAQLQKIARGMSKNAAAVLWVLREIEQSEEYELSMEAELYQQEERIEELHGRQR